MTIMGSLNQKIFTKKHLEILFNELISGNLNSYTKDSFDVLNNSNPAGPSAVILNEEADLLLPEEGGDNFDIANTKIIYNAYKNLTETQASDPRLWVYLTHIQYWSYMRKRWPLEKFEEDTELEDEKQEVKDKKVRFIEWRYHLKTSNTRRLLRNGISRLWWYGYMTYDQNQTSGDPFELTKVLLSYLDIAQSLLERSLGRNKNVLCAFLTYLSKNPNLKRDEIRSKIKEINLIGGVRNLTVLDREEILKTIEKTF